MRDLGSIKCCETGGYHIPLSFQCIYEYSDERGGNGDGEEGRDISGGGKRVESESEF